MEQSSFIRPRFIEDGELEDIPELDNGGRVTVRFIMELPEEMRELIGDDSEFLNSPTGYAIKHYNKGPLNGSQMDPRQDHITMAEKCRLRKRITHLFFKDAPTPLLVPSYYIVEQGSIDENSRPPAAEVYEVQHFLGTFLPIHELSWQFIRDFGIREKLIKQLLYLIPKIEEFSTGESHKIFHNFVPDLHPNNIAATSSGEVKIFDTNEFYLLPDERAVNMIKGTVQTLKGIVWNLIMGDPADISDQ